MNKLGAGKATSETGRAKLAEMLGRDGADELFIGYGHIKQLMINAKTHSEF